MKRMLSIGILLFSLLSACTQTSVETRYGTSLQIDASPELSAIDSLLWHQPDSAFALLLEFAASPKADSLDVFNGHYCQLLVSELLYKNDYEQNNRPDLLLAVTYFDSLLVLADTRGVSLRKSGRRDAPRASAQNTTATIAFLDARAHYINGVGYYENDSVVEACKEYMKALDVMDGYFAENELVEKKAKFMALTYTRLTEIFSDMYLHEQVIYFSKESLNYYNKYNVSISHVAWILNEIGSNYDMMEQLDSADYYYKKAIRILGDTSTLMYRNIVAHQAYLEYKKDFHNANAAISCLLNLLSKSESERETIIRSSYIGEILFHDKRFDSAWMFLNIVFQKTPDIGLKKQAAERLVEICKTQGIEDNILEYASFLVPFANQEENKSEIKTQMTELHKTFIQEKLERQHKKEVRKNKRQALEAIAGMLFVILIISLLYHKNRRRKQNLEALIETERQAHKIQQAAISGRLKKSNEALRIQKKETNDLAKEMAIQQRQTEWNHLNDFMNESICNDIVTALRGKQIKREAKSGDYPELHLSDAQLHELNVAVEKHFHGFEKTLTDLYPKISRNAMNQCLLYLVNMEDVQIAALLSCDYSTVKRRSAKLKQAFGTEKELRQFIREFVL